MWSRAVVPDAFIMSVFLILQDQQFVNFSDFFSDEVVLRKVTFLISFF